MQSTFFPSPHFNERQYPIDMILIHYTDMKSAQETVEWFMNPLSRVSAHYLIDEKGKTYGFVEETKRAWHAGESFWQGCTDINSCSIGIELANPGHTYGYIPFPDPQIEALIELCLTIQSRWGILPSRILGHSDVAPRRKQDPGHLFPWKTLHQKGLGLWPQSESVSSQDLLGGLQQIGYDTTSPSDAIFAFQRHFQPHKVDGLPDEETLLLVAGLLKNNGNCS